MLVLLFVLLWLVSPIVLAILLAVQIRKNSALKRENTELTRDITRLMNRGDKSSENEKAPEKPVLSEPDTPPKTSQSPERPLYDMPRYAALSGTEKTSPPTYVQPPEQYAAPESAQDVQKPQDKQDIQRPAQPVFTDTEKPASMPVQPYIPQGHSVSAINIILILGALLLSLSGFIFAIAAWDRLNTFLRSAILLSFSVLFFVIHSITERKLKLPQTGRVFYILGSVFLPSAVIAAGVLRIFGEYFSFYGEGRAALLSAVFLSVCIPFFKGAHDYKSRFFAAVSCYSFSAALVAAIWQISPDGSVTSLLTAVFALLTVLLEPWVQKLFTRLLGEENVFSAEWNRFSVINAWALSVASLFVADGGFVSMAAFAVFSVCFLTKTITDKGGTAGAIAFAFFITAAMLNGFDPNELSDFVCIVAAVSLICAVLSLMGIFPNSLKKAMGIFGIIAAGAAGLFAICENAGLVINSEPPSVQLIIAAAAIYAQFLIFALRNGTAQYKVMSFAAMLWLLADVSLLIFIGSDSEALAYILSFAAIALYFAAVRFTPLKNKLYFPANDVILCIYGIICSPLCIPDSPVWGLIILLAGAVVLAFSRQRVISGIICPLLTAMTIFPLLEIFSDNNIAAAASYGLLLLYFIAARSPVLKKDFHHPALDAVICALALIYSVLCAETGAVWSIAVIAAGIAAAAASDQKIISPVSCVLLTFSLVFPAEGLFTEKSVSLMTGVTSSDAFAAVTVAVCVAAAALLFVPKLEDYAKAYGIGAAVSVPVFTVLSLSFGTSDFLPALAVTLYTALCLTVKAFPRKKFAYVNLLNFMIIFTSAFIGSYVRDDIYWLCFPAAAALFIFAVTVIGKTFGSFENTSSHTEHFLWYAMPALSGIALLSGHNELASALIVFGIILGLCTVFLAVYRENTLTVIFPILAGLYIVSAQISSVPAMLLAIALAAAGRLIFRERIFGGLFSDIFSIAALPAALSAYSGSAEIRQWLALLLLAALTVNLLRRGQSGAAKNTVLTAAAVFLFPLWLTQPFFTVPELIKVQFSLLPLAVFCVLLRLIWRDAEAAVYNVSFGAAIFSLVVLFFDALSSGEVFDAVFIGIVIMTMLAVSFIIKRKRWFVLAVASMVTSAVLLSFSQRDSIAWLVYLALAGAALIALGVVNELKKQQKRSGEDTKLTRFMSDWTW